jgi:hypothetical protein
MLTDTLPLLPTLGAVHTTVPFGDTVPTPRSAPNRQVTGPLPASIVRPDTVTMLPPPTGPRLGTSVTPPTAAAYSKLTVEAGASTPLLITPRVTIPAPCTGTLHDTIVDVRYSPCTLMTRPNRQLSSEVCWKSLPTTVTTWPSFPLIPRDGRTLVTTASAS